jgi:parallel beta-helix repeat protein
MKKLITCLTVCVLSGVVAAEIHHVPTDFPTIQYAVDAAVDGDEIIVAPGTYTSTADEVVDMRGKEIWLHSSKGAQVTIIDGEGERRGIICNNGEMVNTIIEGFTITNGYDDSVGGSGMYSTSSPTVTNCTFENNTSSENGAGVNCGSGSPTLTNCTFENNTSSSNGGGVYCYSNPTLTNCTFTNNTSMNGGGMYVDYGSGSTATLTNCTFENNTADNQGGGMQFNGGSPTMTNCTFTNNTAPYGGGIFNWNNSNLTLTGCTFTGNIAPVDGGGIWIGNSTITGCDFIQNSALNGGGIFSSGSNEGNSPTISNTNFCENDPDAIDGNWNNSDGNEFLNDCGDVQGACCVKDTCYEVELIFCEALDGEWLGYNATCEEDSCVNPPQYGACCINGEAIPLFDYDCDRILGTFMGEGTNPDDVTCPVHCAEDVTGDGVVDVSDLLAIIAVWGACP